MSFVSDFTTSSALPRMPPAMASSSTAPSPRCRASGEETSRVATALTDVKGATAGLIGVAISASLLPPAVNAGMLWCLAIFGPAVVESDDDISYDVDDQSELFELGAVSFCLTMVNILCIFVVAFGVYTFFGHLRWSWAIMLGYFASIWVHFLVNGSSF